MKFTKSYLKIALIFAIFLSTSCTGVSGILGGHVKAYEGKELDDSQLAIIKNQPNSSPNGSAYVRSIDGITYGDDLLKGWPSIVKTLPGKHQISVKCVFYNNGYANLSFEATFEPGKYYEIRCKTGEDGYLKALATEHKI